MRLTPIALALLIGLTPSLHAQETTKTFTANGAGESATCDAARKQAKDWVKAGKSEGRARTLLDDGACDCTSVDNKSKCTYTVRASDEQHEEEEEG